MKTKHSFSKILLLKNIFLFVFFISCFSTFAQRLDETSQNEIREHLAIYQYLIEDENLDQAALRLAKVAVIYWESSMFDSAANYFIQSAEIFEKNNKLPELKSIYTNIGAVYSEHKKYPKAIEYFQKSLEVAGEFANEKEIALRKIDLANAYSLNKQTKKAFSLLNTVKNYAAQVNDIELVLSVYSQYVNIYRRTGDEWKAREFEFRYNHLYDSVEGDVYNLNERLAVARKQFIEDSIANIAYADNTKKTRAETDTKQEETEVPALSQNDYLQSKKRDALQSFSQDVSIEQTMIANLKKERDMLKDQLNKRIAKERKMILIFVITILVLIIGFFSYILLFSKKD